MKTDKSQDKYNEIFQELREEKMNWDFEDFLAEAEKTENPITEISEKKSARARSPPLEGTARTLSHFLNVFWIPEICA